jgi:NADPH-dependent ferric siderophore reductase
MARTNLRANRIKPDNVELLTLHVLRRERLSPHFVRVTLGEGDVARFRSMGFDQWF